MLVRFFYIEWDNHAILPDNATLNVDDSNTLEMKRLLEDAFQAPVKSFKCEQVKPIKKLIANPTPTKEQTTMSDETKERNHQFTKGVEYTFTKTEAENDIEGAIKLTYNTFIRKTKKMLDSKGKSVTYDSGAVKMEQDDENSYYQFTVDGKIIDAKPNPQPKSKHFVIIVDGVTYYGQPKASAKSYTPKVVEEQKKDVKDKLKADMKWDEKGWENYAALGKKLVEFAAKIEEASAKAEKVLLDENSTKEEKAKAAKVMVFQPVEIAASGSIQLSIRRKRIAD